jgi:L-alanine-DL-glutamate epimerase-like enolase superfamily enzyme
MSSIERVETFIVSIPRDVPYLGPLGPGESINEKGYLIRRGNQTIYPAADTSVLVKVTSRDGAIGWGETYGIIAPEAVVVIIENVFAPIVRGRDPRDACVIQQDLYNLMRVRGFFGGFYVDAMAGLDIALWDLFGQLTGQPLCKLLGGQRQSRIPCYVSGLPRKTIAEKVELAMAWKAKGYRAFKFAAAVSHEGIVAEMCALRDALGPDVDLMVDLHWKFTAAEAIQLIDRLAIYRPMFVEAPCAPEDIEGLARVASASRVPVAGGEEWRTIYEYIPRLEQRCVSFIQPEMGHTGVSQFRAICTLADAFHCRVIPHATIGIGIFMAASLHATSTLLHAPYHEYQHSVFDKNLPYVTGDMCCSDGHFNVPGGPGLGVTPSERVWNFVRR